MIMKTRFLKLLVLLPLAMCMKSEAATSFNYWPLASNMINMGLPTNAANAFIYGWLGEVTAGATNGGPFVWFQSSSTTTNLTNVFRSVYWDSATGQISTGRYHRVSILGAPGTPASGVVTGVDVTGTLPDGLTVAGINGVALGTTTATSGNILIGSGAAWVTQDVGGDATLDSTGALTLANVVVAGTGTKITANAKGLVTTITSATLASADFANQGTTTTLLHGNAAGNPSWGQVVAADINNTTFVTAVTAVAPITSTGGLTPEISTSMATGSLIGRNTAGTGVMEVITDIPTAITVGGAYIYRVGGTDVAVADGGTGLSSGTSGGILGYTAAGTLASSVALATNQIVLGAGAGFTPVPLGSLGTTTTVLHGNATGLPSFGAVSLSADVTGDLPFANIAQIANNSLLGNFTGSTADIQVLTSITSANMAQVLSDETGTLKVVFSDSPAFTTQISTPSIITAAGALGITPVAGSGVNVILSTTGDFAVNTDDLVVDTSTERVGIGTATPLSQLHMEVIARTTAYNAGDWTTWGDVHVVNPHATPAGSAVGISFLSRNANENNGSAGIAAVRGAADYEQSLAFITRGDGVASAEIMRISSIGNVGIGTTTPLAKLAVNGGVNVGADADPGDKNLTVVGLSTTGTLVVTTSSTHSYATASTVAVFDADKKLVSSSLSSAGLLNKSGAGDPITLGTTGDALGQQFLDTTTGGWWRYSPVYGWLP